MALVSVDTGPTGYRVYGFTVTATPVTGIFMKIWTLTENRDLIEGVFLGYRPVPAKLNPDEWPVVGKDFLIGYW